MSRKSTKDTILMTLKKHYELSMKELVSYFTISETAVRKQLNELLRHDFVQERIIRKEIGRPFYRYKLTDKGHQTFPNQHEALPTELLEDLEISEGIEAVDRLLETRKLREQKKLTTETASESFKTRIDQLIAYQEENGYMIDMGETTDGDVEIINYNCPIFNLASEYNIICTHEKEMYRDIFSDSEVISHETMSKGAKYCRWTISPPENEHKGM